MISVIGAIACLGVIGTLIPSLIPIPVQARVVDCNEEPWHPECLMTIPDNKIVIDPDDCPVCWIASLIDIESIAIPHSWNASINFTYDEDSVSLTVNIPNELIDKMKTKMDTGSIQQNSSMIK